MAASACSIVVIEDDAAIRSMLVDMLEFENYQVVALANGVEGLKYLRSAPARPRVILLDLWMPIMDGWHFRWLQQQEEALRDIPVIVMSAAANIRDQQQQASLQASAYITKPIEAGQLLDLIAPFCPA